MSHWWQLYLHRCPHQSIVQSACNWHGDPAKEVFNGITHIRALHPKTNCSFKLLVAWHSNGLEMMWIQSSQCGLKCGIKDLVELVHNGYKIMTYLSSVTWQWHHDDHTQFDKGWGHKWGWWLDTARALPEHQSHSVQGVHILFKVLRPPFWCRSGEWIDSIQPEHNVCNFYHNFPVIVSSEVKHKSKVSEAIILYIRVSAFPRVRTVAGNVCAEKTCEGISFGICTVKDVPLQKHSKLVQEEVSCKMETQIVHTQPLVSASSL